MYCDKCNEHATELIPGRGRRLFGASIEAENKLRVRGVFNNVTKVIVWVVKNAFILVGWRKGRDRGPVLLKANSS